jgi:hypothetical protein
VRGPTRYTLVLHRKPPPPPAVQGSQLYTLDLYTLDSGAGGEHALRLSIPKTGLSAFTFTFG